MAMVATAGLALAGPVAAGGSAKEQVREAAAAKAYAAFEATFNTGSTTADAVYEWSSRWQEATKRTQGALPAARAHLGRMQTLAAAVKGKVAAGLASRADEIAAAYY